jgi:predicted PurR-regulated permease PerM
MNINFPHKIISPEPSAARRNARLRADIRIIRKCAIIVVVVAVLAAALVGASLLAPTAIAATFALILAPVTRTLERLRLPTGLAAALTVAATVAFLSAGAFALTPEVSSWLNDAPNIAQSIERKLQPIARKLAAVESVSNRIAEAANPNPTPATPVRGVPESGGFILEAARTAPSVVEKIIYVTMLTIFLLACRTRYMVQLILLPRRFENRLRIARICRDVRSRVSGYLFTLSLINIGLAAITALCFYIASISDALLWGIAFGLLNYIPILGPTTGIIVAALVGFATADTIPGALAPPLILLALNTVEANLVQPWLVGRRVVISPVAIFLTVVALVWMWGPIAAITAVPTLISFHTIALHLPGLRPIAFLLATEEGAIAMRRSTLFKHGLRRPLRTRPRSA